MSTSNESTSNEIYGSALRILRIASAQPTFAPIYQDTRESARGLADNGYLEPAGKDAYQITEKGRAYLKPRPLTSPKPPRSKDMPRLRRKPAAKPKPQTTQNVLQPLRWVELRPRQKDMLRFIDTYIKKIGFPPTYREIGEEVGIPTTSVVMYNVEQLVAGGWLQRTEGIARSLCLAKELPGKKTKSEIHEARGVLKIAINLSGERDDIIMTALTAIARLQEVIAATEGGE